MRSLIKKSYSLNKNINLAFISKYNIFVLKNMIGIILFYLPSYFFFKVEKHQISFIVLKNFFFKSFISHLFTNYLNINYIYIVRIKMKGLDYQIYKITNKLYSFHFHYINFFYVFVPHDIIIYWYKKRIVLVSQNNIRLKIFFKCILLLKKLGPYRLLGIRYPRQIFLLKKGGKAKAK
jgi:hypothetical protein